MRLINCKTLELEFFELSDAPPYAILSHTWENGEVIFEDFQLPETRMKKKGWAKIELTCRQALANSLCYAWVDSCCIDKRSSSELSESINSMFKWYAHSAECYAYLSDFTQSNSSQDITSCYWFERGWTLQELIAPFKMSFYDKDWKLVGTKQSLSHQISQRTNINESILKAGSFDSVRSQLDACTVAQRMSWAAARKTKRPEDLAYCLLGIFDISMPMLYGEGERAFTRLQEEIIKETNDMTIFAWQSSSSAQIAESYAEIQNGTTKYRGILAERPAEFVTAHMLRPPQDKMINPEYSMTNKGLKIDIGLRQLSYDVFFMPLNCFPSSGPSQQLGICLRNQGEGIYARANPGALLLEPGSSQFSPGQIYISKHLKSSAVQALKIDNRYAFKFTYTHKRSVYRCQTEAMEPRSQWDTANGLFMVAPGQSSFTGYHRVSWNTQAGTAGEFIVLCGYDTPSKPWVCLTTLPKNPQLYNAAKSVDMKTASRLAQDYNNMRAVLKPHWPEHVDVSLAKETRIEGGTTFTTFHVEIIMAVNHWS